MSKNSAAVPNSFADVVEDHHEDDEDNCQDKNFG